MFEVLNVVLFGVWFFFLVAAVAARTELNIRDDSEAFQVRPTDGIHR